MLLTPGGGAPPIFGSEYQDAVSAAVSTTTSTTFVQKLRLATSALPAGRYRLEVSYQWNHDAINSNFEARVQQDDATELMHHVQEPSESGGTFGTTGTSQKYTFSKVMLLNLAAASYNFDLDFLTDNAGDPSSIWDATFTLWRVS